MNERPEREGMGAVWAAVAVAVVLRAAPLLLWGWSGDDCTRDECIFKIAARPILEGAGLGLAPKGWLPAPGFPYLLAACKALFGSFEAVKWVHVALAAPMVLTTFALGRRVGGMRAGVFAAWGMALHPTLVFFAGTMWTETLYTALLLPTVLGVLWAREGGPSRAAAVGFGLGLCVLNRGMATWMAPIFALALLWPDAAAATVASWRAAFAERQRHLAAFAVAWLLTIAPYSAVASARWGGFLVSDATLGHVIAMGNDDYPPLTFDYQIGQLTGPLFARTEARGRAPCPHDGGPVAYDHCEVTRATAWIGAHPGTFLARVPERWSQLFNPHSFLTRHVLWGFWPTLPWEGRQLVVLAQVVCSYVVLIGGAVAMWARGRGPYAVLVAGIWLYYLAVIGALYGLTRFRLPVEPLLVVAVAGALAHPAEVVAGLREHRWRAVGALLTALALAALMGRHLGSGFPAWG
jgi:hypothetical protein